MSLLLAAPPATHAAPSPKTSFFPGVYPEDTATAAAAAQHSIDQGHSPWQVEPRMVVDSFTRWIGWRDNPSSARVIQRQGTSVLVSISHAGNPALKLFVRLRQLGHTGPGGIWFVVSAYSTNLRLMQPVSGQLVHSPVTFRGSAAVFEGEFTFALRDANLKFLARASATTKGAPGMHAFTARLALTAPVTTAIAEIFDESPKDGTLRDLALTKVRLAG